MANKHTEFWLALLDYSHDKDQRARFWNGYLGWKLPSKIKENKAPKGNRPKLCVAPPEGGWPELTEEEQRVIEILAERHGGQPEYSFDYMNFSDRIFSGALDLSGLILIGSNFSRTTFKGQVTLSDKTWFYVEAWFHEATFESGLYCDGAWFETSVSFAGACFKTGANFINANFMDGASFAGVVFEGSTQFNYSRFVETYDSRGWIRICLVDFRNAKFMAKTSFQGVVFGNDDSAVSGTRWPERRADFTDAEFATTTKFSDAVFSGPPAFFNTILHEDTDFGGIDWGKAETDNVSVDYAIRAWERLELMMSKLEKPLDRHRFLSTQDACSTPKGRTVLEDTEPIV